MSYKRVVSEYRKCRGGILGGLVRKGFKWTAILAVLFAIYEAYRLFTEDFKFVRLVTLIIMAVLAYYCRKAMSLANKYYDKKLGKWKKRYFEPYLDSLTVEFTHDFEVDNGRFSYNKSPAKIPADEVPVIFDLHYNERPKLTYVDMEKGFSEDYPSGHYKHILHLPTKFGEVTK